jgi:hypothetical protein
MNTALDIDHRPNLSVLRQKIGWLCHLIRWLLVLYAAWVLYLNLEPVLIYGAQNSAKQWALFWELPEGSVTIGEVYANRAIVLISWASVAWLTYAVWRLMGCYLDGDIFSAQAAEHLRHVGVVGFISALIDVSIRPFLFGVLSTDIFQKMPIMGWVEPRDIMYVSIALFIVSLGHIQRTAATISDENRQFV